MNQNTQGDARPPLLSVRDLHAHFNIARRWRQQAGLLRAVDGVSLDIERATTLGLVGESGCGKTTLGRTLLRLNPARRGTVEFDGVSVLDSAGTSLKRLRRDMQMVFQDPSGSLNPRMRIGDAIAEPMVVHRVGSRRERASRVADLLRRVGLESGDAQRFPHEFSGGQRQRIGIARALALQPKFIICDEPVSALDVSVQAQIINLLKELQRDFGLTYLFIAHNLAVVRHMSDHVAVMYLGRIVESAPRAELFERPRHPYTMALIAAVPEPDPALRQTAPALPGEPPSPIDPPSGCAFHPRCRFATDECRALTPTLERKPGMVLDHLVACHHAEAIAGLNPPSSLEYSAHKSC